MPLSQGTRFIVGLPGADRLFHCRRHNRHLASLSLPLNVGTCIPRGRSLTTTKASSQVHILGLGSIGTFTAHALAEIPQRPSVSLLLHRPSLVDEYVRDGRKLVLETRQGQSIAHTGFGVEVLHNPDWHTIDLDSHTPVTTAAQEQLRNPTSTTISDLIVCVKSTQTVAALRPLLPRLSRSSNVMFLQNGAGMIEDANTFLWPNPSTRPNYITGVISHGVALNKPFHATHTGPAATAIGPVPRDDTPDSNTSQSSSYMLDALPLAQRLNCRTYGWPTILQIQLEKLATNAFSNPLCTLVNSSNSYLFTIPETCRALMEEISSVILALPELQGVNGVTERFSAKALETTVMDIVEKNRASTVSMVWDMRAGRETEIRYINGYWARRGREVGVRTPLNDELVERVRARTVERKREMASGSQP